MKAMVQDTYGSADVLELREIDIPVIGDDQVLVCVRAAGVNPADWGDHERPAVHRPPRIRAAEAEDPCSRHRRCWGGRGHRHQGDKVPAR